MGRLEIFWGLRSAELPEKVRGGVVTRKREAPAEAKRRHQAWPRKLIFFGGGQGNRSGSVVSGLGCIAVVCGATQGVFSG